MPPPSVFHPHPRWFRLRQLRLRTQPKHDCHSAWISEDKLVLIAFFNKSNLLSITHFWPHRYPPCGEEQEGDQDQAATGRRSTRSSSRLRILQREMLGNRLLGGGAWNNTVFELRDQAISMWFPPGAVLSSMDIWVPIYIVIINAAIPCFCK